MPARKSSATTDKPGSTDRRIDALLTLLSENPMIVISGEKIARRNRRDPLGGVAMDAAAAGAGRAREGPSAHRLSDRARARRAFAELAAAAVAQARHSASASTTSSKPARPTASALELGHSGEPHGTLILAEEQSGGRGRSGRDVAFREDQRNLHDACCCARRSRRLSRR